MTNESRYDALARWAEAEMEPEDAATVLTGEDAIRDARATLARAGVGRPKLAASAPKGERSPRRQVRMSQEMSDAIDALADARGESPSDIMREALTSYLRQHPTKREARAAARATADASLAAS